MNIYTQVCVVLYTEGAGLMQGKALASAVVVHFPPREILTFPPKPTFSSAFPFERSLQVAMMCEPWKQRKRKWPLTFCFPPPPSPSFSSVFPSKYWCWGRGTYSVGAHVIWLESGGSRHYLPSHPVTLLLSKRLCKRLYTL